MSSGKDKRVGWLASLKAGDRVGVSAGSPWSRTWAHGDVERVTPTGIVVVKVRRTPGYVHWAGTARFTPAGLEAGRRVGSRRRLREADAAHDAAIAQQVAHHHATQAVHEAYAALDRTTQDRSSFSVAHLARLQAACAEVVAACDRTGGEE